MFVSPDSSDFILLSGEASAAGHQAGGGDASQRRGADKGEGETAQGGE